MGVRRHAEEATGVRARRVGVGVASDDQPRHVGAVAVGVEVPQLGGVGLEGQVGTVPDLAAVEALHRSDAGVDQRHAHPGARRAGRPVVLGAGDVDDRSDGHGLGGVDPRVGERPDPLVGGDGQVGGTQVGHPVDGQLGGHAVDDLERQLDVPARVTDSGCRVGGGLLAADDHRHHVGIRHGRLHEHGGDHDPKDRGRGCSDTH